MPMLIKEYFEDREIGKPLKALTPLLRKRYDGSPPYTYDQVKATVAEEKLNKRSPGFAFLYSVMLKNMRNIVST